jgi:FkbM family methyltransferase
MSKLFKDCFDLRTIQAFSHMVSSDMWAPIVAAPGYFDLVLDIGAHIGWSTAFSRMFNPQARIVAFEPCQVTFDLLTANVSGLGIETVKLALGDGSSGIMSEGEATVRNRFVVGAGDLPSATLDKIVSQYAGAAAGKRTLLLINCEGGERSILGHKPSLKAIAAVDLVILEAHGRNLIRSFHTLFSEFGETHLPAFPKFRPKPRRDFILVSKRLIAHLESGGAAKAVLEKLDMQLC